MRKCVFTLKVCTRSNKLAQLIRFWCNAFLSGSPYTPGESLSERAAIFALLCKTVFYKFMLKGYTLRPIFSRNLQIYLCALKKA